MLNEHKQKILGGAYGISRGGSKCKFVGVTTNKSSYNHTVVYFNDDGLIWHQLSLTEDFGMYNDRTSQHDVVGLWSDDPKPVAYVAPVAPVAPIKVNVLMRGFTLAQKKMLRLGLIQ